MSKIWYRGTPNRTNDASKLKGDIIWFTSDYTYAKSYADAYKGIVIKADLDCDNTFDAGVTDDRLCNLFPVFYPFKLSSKMLNLLEKLHTSEEEFWEIFSSLEKDRQEFYQYKIFTIVRTPQFRNFLISKGYDSVKTVEFGSECLGVFDTSQIHLVTYSDKGLDNLLKKMYNIDIDESKRGIHMKKINESVSIDIKKSKLADYLGVDEEEVVVFNDDHFGVDDAEYLVCDKDEAYALACSDIQNSFDDLGLDAFTSDFRDYILYHCLADNYIEDVIRDDLWNSYSDLFTGEDISSDEIEKRTNDINDKVDSIDDPIEYLDDNYGKEFLNDLISCNPGIVDMQKVYDECIDLDGVAHFIAYYDGDEMDLGEGIFAYRQN